jgi:hypothetical protein
MVADVHFFIQDKSGKSIAVEPSDGVLKVTNAPLGVMTNAPTYDWHMTNLDNYLNLTVKDIGSEKLSDVTLNATGSGSGSGLLGLPGGELGGFAKPAVFAAPAVSPRSLWLAFVRRDSPRSVPFRDGRGVESETTGVSMNRMQRQRETS